MGELGQNWANAGNIGPVLAQLNNIMACLQGWCLGWVYIVQRSLLMNNELMILILPLRDKYVEFKIQGILALVFHYL